MQISHNFPTCTVEITLHALKGQKLLAQGSALGFCLCESSTPCFTLIEQALSVFFNVNYI